MTARHVILLAFIALRLPHQAQPISVVSSRAQTMFPKETWFTRWAHSAIFADAYPITLPPQLQTR
jgi:hypothetical protein